MLECPRDPGRLLVRVDEDAYAERRRIGGGRSCRGGSHGRSMRAARWCRNSRTAWSTWMRRGYPFLDVRTSPREPDDGSTAFATCPGGWTSGGQRSAGTAGELRNDLRRRRQRRPEHAALREFVSARHGLGVCPRLHDLRVVWAETPMDRRGEAAVRRPSLLLRHGCRRGHFVVEEQRQPG